MVRIVRVRRTNDAHVVDASRRQWKQLTNRQPGLAALTKSKRRRQETGSFPLRSEIGFGRPLAGKFLQIRFGIKQVALKRTAIHEEMDDSLRLARKLRGLKIPERGLTQSRHHPNRTNTASHHPNH